MQPAERKHRQLPSRDRLALVVAAALASACSSAKLPSHWPTGGARLDLVQAQWTYGKDPVEIKSRVDWAEVKIDGDTELVLDRVGRVYDKHRSPIGVLESDGRFVGMDEELLGVVGSSYAALPGKANAWIAFNPNGQIVKYEADGTPKVEGQWVGCHVTPFAQQACLLIAYTLFYRDEGREMLERERTQSGAMMPAPGLGLGVTAP